MFRTPFLTYRVPLGEPLLLLEPGVLPPVVDGGEDLPHEDEHEADGDDGADHAQDDPHDVHHHGALFGRLHPHLQRACRVVVSVHEGGATVVVVDERAESLVLVYVVLCLLHLNKYIMRNKNMMNGE